MRCALAMAVGLCWTVRTAAFLCLACGSSARISASQSAMRLRGGKPVAEERSRSNWEGPFTFPDGAMYYGETKDGRICGEGEWRSAEHDHYAGSFKDDVFHGAGTYTYADGDKFEGSFEHGVMHGAGTYLHADGRADVGSYEKGDKVGPGVRWSPDRQQAWRLLNGDLVSSDPARAFDKKEDRISLAEAEEIAAALGLSMPPSVYEVTDEGTAQLRERLARNGAGAATDSGRFELSAIDPRLAGTSLEGASGLLVAHSAQPVVPETVCDAIVAECEARAARLGGWSTKRHESNPTTDVPLQLLPRALAWFRAALLPEVAWPFLAQAFGWALPAPEGGGEAAAMLARVEALRVAEAFVVKYNASSGQRELKFHRDGAVFSFNIALNELDEYEGGGTSFRVLGEGEGGAIRSPKGHLMSHSSALMHGGHKLVSGCRYILVVFVTLTSEHEQWATRFNEHVAANDGPD